jgi:hypothetical protein
VVVRRKRSFKSSETLVIIVIASGSSSLRNLHTDRAFEMLHLLNLKEKLRSLVVVIVTKVLQVLMKALDCGMASRKLCASELQLSLHILRDSAPSNILFRSRPSIRRDVTVSFHNRFRDKLRLLPPDKGGAARTPLAVSIPTSRCASSGIRRVPILDSTEPEPVLDKQ